MKLRRMGADVSEIYRLNIVAWVLFFFFYLTVGAVYTTWKLTEDPYPLRIFMHLFLYIPLGVFLWRREFSLSFMTPILLFMTIVPECVQYLYVRENLHDVGIDVFLNVIGGGVGMVVGMAWTLWSIVAR